MRGVPSRWLNSFGLRDCLPCVGLVIIVGCGMVVVTPDPEIPAPKKIAFTRAIAPPVLPTVILDPGHGGNDEGCKGHGLLEKDVTLDTALRVEQMMRTFNFPTVLTRREDRYVSLPERAAIANAIDDAIFVSIHFNQAREGNGVETYYADQKLPAEFAWTWVGLFATPPSQLSDSGETLAGYIQTSLVQKLDASNRGIKSRGLYVVRHVRFPAVLVEGGFISNSLEAQMLHNDDYRERLASGIAEGILRYYKSQHPQGPPQPPAKLADLLR
jgi:N-acetylmuramoyl-L-alanine amidase